MSTKHGAKKAQPASDSIDIHDDDDTKRGNEEDVTTQKNPKPAQNPIATISSRINSLNFKVMDAVRDMKDQKAELDFEFEKMKQHLADKLHEQMKKFKLALKDVAVYKEKDQRQDQKLGLLRT